MYVIIHVFDYTRGWLYTYLIMHVFDYAFTWPYMFLIIHVFDYTYISIYMYLIIILFDNTCIFLYMYLTVHVNSTRGRNNPHSKSGRARDDYLQPFSLHSVDYAKISLYICVPMLVFDHTCMLPYMCLTMHAPAHTCT